MKHWSQMMKNKKGKMVTVGGHNYALKMNKKRHSKIEDIRMNAKKRVC